MMVVLNERIKSLINLICYNINKEVSLRLLPFVFIKNMFIGTLKRGTILVIFKNTFTQVIRVFIRNLLLVNIVGVTSQYIYAANNYDATQIECLTRNTYEEARGESEKGKVAVIYTVLNRTKDNRFPSKPCAVIHSKGQFEWVGKAKPIKEHDTYQETKELVLEVLSGKHRDPTQGSLYFNSHHKQPKGTRCTIRIGNHSFYKPIK